MAQYDDVNNKSIVMVGIFSILITIVTILGCEVLYYAMQERQNSNKMLNTEYVQSIQTLSLQREDLNSYGKEKRDDKDYLKIPIDAAVKALIREKGSVADAPPAKDDA